MSRYSSARFIVCLAVAIANISTAIGADFSVRRERSLEQRVHNSGPAADADKSCGQVNYEYRPKPKYTDMKTLCSGPWTPPITDEY